MSSQRVPRAGAADPAGAARSAVDWAEIEARIEEVGRRLAADSVDSPEQTRIVLAERARALAVPVVSGGDEPRLEVVTLDLGGRSYVLESRHIVEMVRHPPTAPLPGAEPPVSAVAAWRGRLLTVLDFRPAAPGGAAARVPLLVLLGGERAEIGLLADGVGDISTIPLDQLRDVPDGPMRWRDYLRALTADAVPLIDGDALLERHALDR